MKNLFLLNRLGFNPDLTTRQSRVDSVSIASRYRVLATLLLCLTLFVGVGNAWGADAQCTLSNANIVAGGTAATGYGSKTMTDGCSQTWNAYAIKNKHSNATSSYHFLQIRAYNNPTAYYVQVPEKTGYTIKSITMVVSNTNQPRTGGGNSATLFFSASNSTSSAGAGVASGTGSSSVTIDCSSLSLTTGYITASGAVRIWGDIVVTYTPSGAPSKVSTPTFSVAAGTYIGSQSVTISCATASATIHYTTDGTTPTGSSPTYSSAISVDVTQTIKAIAIKDGMTNSDVAEAAYTIKCATPTFSPAAGTYGAVQSVSISTTYGTNIYYTTDGTTPTTSSTLYSSAISVSSSQTIKAIAVKSGCSDSDVGEAAYTINIPYTVSFSTGIGNPLQGNISEASAGAGITLPAGPSPSCSSDGWSFAGWGYESCDDESTEPTLYIAGNKYYPSSNETLYAVYVKGKTASTNYKLISDAAQIVSGENYVIAAYYNSNDYAITAEIQSSYYIKQTAVTVTENVISSPGAKIIWQLTNEGGSNVSLYNSNQSKYLYVYASSSYRNLGLYASKKEFTMTEEREAGYASTFAFKSTDYTSYYINYDASHTDFGTKTSSDENLYLYKRQYTGTYESNPTCCTTWDAPTVSYSSSLAINASEGVTIGSGTTHGAVTYESSDEDVLTVDADGTIHAVGAGTAHITATWAGDATYCEKSANSNDVTVSGIQVTGTTPVNFGQVYQNAVVANKTISVTGLGLASAIIPSLPAGSPFSFSPASLAKDCSGATLTISASTATLGTYNQTLTLTSGAFSATVTVKMEVIAMPTATFTDALHGLTEDEDGVSLSSYNLTAAQGTPVVFPTLANQTKSAGTCEGEYYIFVGWTEGDNNTDPEAHLVTSYTLANGDAKHYYAVWADASGSATYTKLTTNTFKTAPTKYVIGVSSEGTIYYLHDCANTDANNSWGYTSSDPSTDAPIEFTLSGSAAALVATSTEGSARYLKPLTAKNFQMSGSSQTITLNGDGTIHNTGDNSAWNLRGNATNLRWYDGTTGNSAYFYEVSAGGTVHYRTSCCANKVDAPVVTATAVTSTSITLTWPSDVKATGWQIEWNGAGGWVTPSGSCTHTVSGLTPNTTYTWRVRATYEDPVCGADVRSGSTTTNQVYHVTYAKGSGTGTCTASGSTTDATGYEAGATVTLQSNGFSLSGHVFNAWTEDDPDVTISNNQFTMPDHDVVITASWTAKVDKYFDRMHDQTDALHGGVEETEGTNEGKYYIPKEGCNYSVPTAVDSNTGDACQTSHYKLQGWIAASYMKGYPDHMTGEIGTGNEGHIFPPTGTRTATGATYYAIWAEVTE